MKGLTKWFPRSVNPVREGYYEVAYIITSMQRYAWTDRLYWDGVGFIVNMPLQRVLKWRGLTKNAVRMKSDDYPELYDTRFSP